MWNSVFTNVHLRQERQTGQWFKLTAAFSKYVRKYYFWSVFIYLDCWKQVSSFWYHNPVIVPGTLALFMLLYKLSIYCAGAFHFLKGFYFNLSEKCYMSMVSKFTIWKLVTNSCFFLMLEMCVLQVLTQISSWHTLGPVVPTEHCLNGPAYLTIVAVHHFITSVHIFWWLLQEGWLKMPQNTNHPNLVPWTERDLHEVYCNYCKWPL